MLKSKQFKKALPLLLALKSHGKDFDLAEILIGRIWDLMKVEFGFKKNSQADLEQQMELVAKCLELVNKRALKRIWLWPSWRMRRWWPVLLWVREELFANTKSIELSMANVYYLRFADVVKVLGNSKSKKDSPRPLNYTRTEKESARYDKAFGELLGHLVIRKRWNWRKLKLERVKYHSREVLALGRQLLGSIDDSTKLWLVNYFEEQLKLFVETFPAVFGHQDNGTEGVSVGMDAPMFQNGHGWIVVLEDVALQGAYGDFDKVCDNECVTIWLFLEHQKIKANAAR
jgi:hypothetical protein